MKTTENKFEPLKNKSFELDPNASGDEGAAFWFKDVKSALQGLMEDIELECKPYDMLYGEVGNRKLSFEEIKQLIRKWFPDVEVVE